MSQWGSGYITDITYVTGWYREQMPSIMALACMLTGVASPMPAAGDDVRYLELGCGNGLTAMSVAACNPGWQVTAVDFHPAHIATARAWAAEAGLANIAFIEADLATLAGDAAARTIPVADFVSMHGVWSWVPQPVRDGIVRLLRDKVQPGGAVHISYNSLPAWGNALGFQRLLRSVGRARAVRSDRQAAEGFKFARELVEATAPQLERSYIVQALMKQVAAMPVTYLAHEYMNESWSPCFMADVAAALSDAKLEWVGSAHLIENFAELTLNEAQRGLMRQFDDPMLRELVKDHCIDRMLRHDVYVRGARRRTPAERDAALGELWLNLNVLPEDLPLEADIPAGRAELNPDFYGPVARALADGPRRVADLLSLPALEGKRDNPGELVGVLVGSNLADVAARPGAAPAAAAQRFNSVAARRLITQMPANRPMGAATVRMGTPAPASLLDLAVLDRTLQGEGDLDALVAHFHRLDVVADETRMREVLAASVAQRLPRLRAAGVW